MADIDEIISGARGNTKYDFAAIGDPVKTFRDAQKQADETNLRRAFKDGVPTGPDGQPDFAAMAKVLFQKGGLEQGVAASNLDISRQQIKNGQVLADRLGAMEGGGQPSQPSIVSPPSANRTATVPVAAPLARGGAQPGGQPRKLRRAAQRSWEFCQRRAFQMIRSALPQPRLRGSLALKTLTRQST
jgi:hypothetical protein